MRTTEETAIRIMIIDENPLRCMLLEQMVDQKKGLSSIGAYANCESIVDVLENTPPDVVLVDVGSVDSPGMFHVRRLRNLDYAGPIIMVGADDQELLFQALCAGATGYVPRNVSPEEFYAVLDEAHQQCAVMSARLAKRALNHFQMSDEDLLSEEELITLGFLSRGLSVQQVARKFLTSQLNIRKHIYQIYIKLVRVCMKRRHAFFLRKSQSRPFLQRQAGFI